VASLIDDVEALAASGCADCVDAAEVIALSA
jgi:hypothetical protein